MILQDYYVTAVGIPGRSYVYLGKCEIMGGGP